MIFTLSLWTSILSTKRKPKMRSQSPTSSEAGVYEIYIKSTEDGEYETYDTEYRLDSMYH